MKYLTLLFLVVELAYSQPFTNGYRKNIPDKQKPSSITSTPEKFNKRVDAKNGFREFKLGSDIRKYFNKYEFNDLTEKRSATKLYTLTWSELENNDLKTLYGVPIDDIAFFCYSDYRI